MVSFIIWLFGYWLIDYHADATTMMNVSENYVK